MEPRQEPKKLYKSRKDNYIDGVCGGIAEYFGIDSTLVRIGLIIFSLMGGSGVVAYIIAMCIIPRAPKKKKKKNRDGYAEGYEGYDGNNDYDEYSDEYDDHSNGPRPQ